MRRIQFVFESLLLVAQLGGMTQNTIVNHINNYRSLSQKIFISESAGRVGSYVVMVSVGGCCVRRSFWGRLFPFVYWFYCMRVLLIEDNEKISGMVAENLQKACFITEPTLCADEAFSAMATSNFDLAILDLGLPDQDGLDILKKFSVS